MRRFGVVVTLIGSLLAMPVAAFAAPRPAAPPPHEAAAMVDGTVTGIDYQRGILDVATAHGTLAVSILPSTSVQAADPGYHGITDVTKGAHVQIFTVKSGDRFLAQIIRLLKR